MRTHLRARSRRVLLGTAAGAAVVIALTPAVAALAGPLATTSPTSSASTTTPIKHLVVIYGENVSFDHYFGTYPTAANTDGVTFQASKKTPTPNNLVTSGTLTDNPNRYAPQRLGPAQAITCDQNHGYTAEQKAVDGGKMDTFVENTNVESCSGGQFHEPGLVMDYYDGNTVTAMWNYAQHFALSDNSWDTTFGPSTPGALNLIAGQTHGGVAMDPTTGAVLPTSSAVAAKDSAGVGTVVGDPDPAYDDCSDADHTTSNAVVAMQGKNIGDLLNAKKVTWGWFQGGFRPTTAWDGKAGDHATCDATSTNTAGGSSRDYSPHHSPFEYYASTSNPHHLPPSSAAMIGRTDQANHNYDLTDFDTALKNGNLPAVSFLKAPEAQDGHPGYSGPLDEQKFLVKEINAIQQSKDWAGTAIVLAYDDSDGWYDHAAPTMHNGSNDPANDTALCSSVSTVLGGYQDRCGPSQRLPLLVISPYSKRNHIDHTETNQSSILAFIEANWGTGGIGDASFDASAGSLTGMFDFSHADTGRVLLSSNGSVQGPKS